MPRKTEKRGALLQRAASAVKRLFLRGRADLEPVIEQETAPLPRVHHKSATQTQPSRPPRREADIPLDVLARTYTPKETSSKASFRSDGSDHQQDQEFAFGVADERWNDEDRLTNKSGDPRIGTHRRTYEPGEAREQIE